MVQPIDYELMKQAVTDQLPSGTGQAARARAERFRQDGVIVSARFGDLPYDDGQVWRDATQRARARFLHGFLFFSDWHTVLSDDKVAASYAQLSVDVIRTWAKDHADGTLLNAVSHHDETTAQRLIQLTALLPQLDGLVSSADQDWLFDLALKTARLLKSDEFHATGNNHGMFQDLALLYFSVLSDSVPEGERRSYFETSTNRLYSYFSSAFNSDGVHRENTPTYHLMVCKQVHCVLRILSGINHDHVGYYRTLLADAAEYATHALMPNGMFPPISDTTQQVETRAARQNIFGSEQFAFAASAGKLGSRPHRRTLVLPESGYAIYRSSWDDPGAVFAFFSAAYNANYHKHSDDLSLFLRSGGVDLLCEAGPYGYDYKDPLTKFAYSSYAHNCLIVDGVSLPRTDSLNHLTTLESHEVRNDGYHVTGETKRLKDTTHSRGVDIRELEGIPQIDVTDTIVSQENHSYELMWNLGEDVEPVVHGQGFELFHKGRKVMDLQFDADVPTKVSLHQGEKRPKYLGWRFPRFGEAVPSSAIKVSFEGSRAQLHTRIRLSNFNYLDRGLNDKSVPWQRIKAGVGLNYLSVPAVSNSRAGKLAVVFTSIHSPGDFTFNYKKSVDATGVNALYILDDFGDQGSYYLADHGDNAIFASTQALIARELKRLRLTPADLITAGSSKGGSAAILHGIAAQAGRIIVGAPQVKIGSFLRKPHPNILRFITGDTTDACVASLDNVIFEALNGMSDSTRLSILVGDADHHYRNHVLPLKSHADATGKAIELTVLPGLPHAEIGSVYRSFLSANIEQELTGKRETAPPHTFGHAPDDARTLGLDVHAPTGWEVACRLFLDSNLVARIPYGESSTTRWKNLPAGRYRARVFLRNPSGDVVRSFTTSWSTLG